jgi:hypothetical protein
MDGMNMPPYPLAAPAGAADATAERTPARCLNCGAGLEAAFCGACGQRAATHRFTVPRLLRDAASGVLSFDSATLRTAHALVTRPGAFIRAYLSGRRQGYVGPLRYYLIVVALNVGAAALLRHRAADARGRASTGTFWDENFVALQIGAAFAVLALLVSATQHLLLQRRAGYTLAEHYGFALYVVAQSVLVTLAVRLALWPLERGLSGNADGVVWLAAFTAYFVWAGGGFFQQPAWRVALRLLAAYAVVLVCLGVAGAVLVAALGTPGA